MHLVSRRDGRVRRRSHYQPIACIVRLVLRMGSSASPNDYRHFSVAPGDSHLRLACLILRDGRWPTRGGNGHDLRSHLFQESRKINLSQVFAGERVRVQAGERARVARHLHTQLRRQSGVIPSALLSRPYNPRQPGSHPRHAPRPVRTHRANRRGRNGGGLSGN